MPLGRSLILASISVWCLACGSSSPTGLVSEQRRCRVYPTSLTENGAPYSCELRVTPGGPVTLSCRGGVGFLRETRYRQVADFVDEAAVPHRLRRTSWTSAFYGMIASTAVTIQSYGYDSDGRLVERRREGGESISFDSWDSRGRPTSGTMTCGTTTERVSIGYDDASRTATWSNGESHTLDADGSMVSETLVYWCGGGRPGFQRDYVIVATSRICEQG